MTDPQKDDHIEELLGKLQGIFGKLSHSEEEEAKQKIEIPTAAPKERETKETPPTPIETPAAKPPEPAPLPMYNEPSPPVETPPAPEPEPAPVPATPPPTPSEATSVISTVPGGYETTVPSSDPEKIIVPTAVYFPPGREAEGKSLAQKLETMAPKFTKVAFRLRVGVFMSYDPKSDWKDAVIQKARETQFQTVFVVMDRALEDTKRKAIVGELESQNVYFQEVTLALIEKKAFYTDVLLGLVFFFDSRKPKADAEGAS